MDGTEIVLVAFFGLLAACVCGCGVAAFIWWKDMWIRKLTSDHNQMLDVMEDYMFALDREITQLWGYILFSKSEDSKGGPK